MNLNNFLISAKASLRDALAMVGSNKHGFILGTAENGAVLGLATDGDIRRCLLENNDLDQCVENCLNDQFMWATADTPREFLLKRLDQVIRVIPILDSQRRLMALVSRDHFPILDQQQVYARARAPVRISFGGGGSDLTHYFATNSGAVINATIGLYSHATLRRRSDSRIRIFSRDLNRVLDADDLYAALHHSGEFRLIQALLKTIHPEYGFDLYLHSDFPMNSGLGGSAVVSAAVLGCFNEFRQDRWDTHELAELAFQAERLYLGIAGGWQDQYATVFGGFNFIEFRMDKNLVHPLRINPDILLELEESLIICNTGLSHDSGAIHDDQRNEFARSDIQTLVKENVALTYRLRDDLLRGRLLEFGRLLDRAWQQKRQFSKKISNTKIDALYEHALKNGAVGGKLLGAGGGGYFLFYVTPFLKYELMDALAEKGLQVQQFRFDNEGLRSWSVRESRNNLEIVSV